MSEVRAEPSHSFRDSVTDGPSRTPSSHFHMNLGPVRVTMRPLETAVFLSYSTACVSKVLTLRSQPALSHYKESPPGGLMRLAISDHQNSLDSRW